MMIKRISTGVMFLPTVTAAALWIHEIMGQLSDGRWEHSTPHDHYKFWCGLDVRVDAAVDPHVDSVVRAPRTRYNLRALLDLGSDCDFRYEIRDRMVCLGRLELASARLRRPWLVYEQAMMAHQMPGTLAEFQAAKAETMEPRAIELYASVDDELARVYYTQPDVMAYGLKQMKEDVDTIKAAMVTARA